MTPREAAAALPAGVRTITPHVVIDDEGTIDALAAAGWHTSSSQVSGRTGQPSWRRSPTQPPSLMPLSNSPTAVAPFAYPETGLRRRPQRIQASARWYEALLTTALAE